MAKPGNLLGEPFDGYVRDQIEVRQTIQGSGYDSGLRTPQEQNYLNNRNAWVKMASSVGVQSEGGTKKLEDIGLNNPENFLGVELAKKAILFNGLSQLETEGKYIHDKNGKKQYVQPGPYNQRSGISETTNIWNNTSAYGLGGISYGIQPMPGITDISIEAVNRGSIRKATVNIKAFNKFQFELIELLYIRLGYTMMLEWGWDKYTHYDSSGNIEYEDIKSTIIENFWFSSKNTSQIEMIRTIEGFRKLYHGNYDGFFGKVSNFDWKFNPDGSYDITLSLITIGDVIESLKINNKSISLTKQEVEAFSSNSSFKYLENSPIVSNATNDVLSQYLFSTIGSDLFSGGNNNYFLSKTDSSNKESGKYSYFITFKELLNLIQTLVIPNITNGTNKSSLLTINTNEELNICTSYYSLISVDPRVCLIQPQNRDENSNITTYVPFTKLKPFITSTQITDVVDGKTLSAEMVYGKIMNIYINYDFISQNLKATTTAEEFSLFEFLTKICDGINNSLGGVTSLEVTIKDDYYITIIDQNSLPEALYKSLPTNPYNFNNSKKPVDLQIYGYTPGNVKNQTKTQSNFVKNISFKTKIDPSLASMISIGATADNIETKNMEATAFSSWNTGLEDRFSLKYSQTETVPDSKFDDTGKPTREFLKSLWDKSGNTGINFSTDKDVVYEEKEFNNVTLGEFFEEFDDYWREKNTKDETGKSKKEKEEYAKTWEGYLFRMFNEDGYYKFEDSLINEGRDLLSITYTRLLNESYLKTKSPNNTIGFIPVTFDVTLDGISGVKIYQSLNIQQEFLPRQYPKSFKFLISKVNHKVSDNSWETNLNTISTSNIEAAPINYFTGEGFNTIETTPPNSNSDTPKPPSTGEFIFMDRRNGTSLYKDNIIDIDRFILYEINIDARPAFTLFLNALRQNYGGYTFYLNALDRTMEKSVELKKENKNNASPGKSGHNYNAAIDVNVVTPDGTTLRKKGDGDKWKKHKIPSLAYSCGLRWGGDFSGYEDNVHFDYNFNRNIALANLETQFGVTDLFNKNQTSKIIPSEIRLNKLVKKDNQTI